MPAATIQPTFSEMLIKYMIDIPNEERKKEELVPMWQKKKVKTQNL